jgi:ADP-ribosylglycohydrolase
MDRSFKVVAESFLISGAMLIADPTHNGPLVWMGALFIAFAIFYGTVGCLFEKYAGRVIDQIIERWYGRRHVFTKSDAGSNTDA